MRVCVALMQAGKPRTQSNSERWHIKDKLFKQPMKDIVLKSPCLLTNERCDPNSGSLHTNKPHDWCGMI